MTERIRKLYLDRIGFDAGRPDLIQHFTKVHAYARLIGEGEGLGDKAGSDGCEEASVSPPAGGRETAGSSGGAASVSARGSRNPAAHRKKQTKITFFIFPSCPFPLVFICIWDRP